VGGLIGGGGADRVWGGRGSDRLTDGPGADRLFGGRGPDMLIPSEHRAKDLLDGQAGRDLVFYFHAPRGVRVNLALGFTVGYGDDRLRRIEDAEGSRFDDVLIGDGGPNELLGVEGDDRIFGGAGPDLLDGFAGTDDLLGGPGHDRCIDGERHRSCEVIGPPE
jgi:Ca2+-binding RTX toxin-like protein